MNSHGVAEGNLYRAPRALVCTWSGVWATLSTITRLDKGSSTDERRRRTDLSSSFHINFPPVDGASARSVYVARGSRPAVGAPVNAEGGGSWFARIRRRGGGGIGEVARNRRNDIGESPEEPRNFW